MNIAMFTDSFYPELSGISDSVATLSHTLALRGHRIEIHAPRYTPREYAIAGIQHQDELDLGRGVRIVRHCSWPAPAGTRQARAALPAFPVRAPAQRPAIVHSHLCFGLGVAALLWALRMRVPVLGTNHTAIAEFARYSPAAGAAVMRPLQSYWTWYYNRCNFVTAPSRSVFQEMAGTGLHRPHEVVSNPIDLATFAPGAAGLKPALKGRFGLSGTTLVFAGRLAEEKRIDILIRALAAAQATLPGLGLAIAGHGRAELPLRRLARELAVADRVAFLGTLDARTLATLYRAADLFVTASPSETQGLSMMQAMACGLPVAGVRARALPEYILPGTGLMVEAGDFTGLAREIAALLQHPDRLRALGEGARRLAERFSAARIADQVERIYLRLAPPNGTAT